MKMPMRLAAVLFLAVWFLGEQEGPRGDQGLPADKVFVNTLGMKLVRLEPGDFVMGQGDGPPQTKDEWLTRDWDEAPAHPVKITRLFYLGATEVTNAQYEQFDPAHRELRGKFGASHTDPEPVTHVTWAQAVAFCDWLTTKEGKPYRLPTEAEWEYACRAGTTTAFATGATLTPEQANFGLTKDGKTNQSTVPVGSYPPNAWGLYDMYGNVAEWCLDWHGPYKAGPQSDPVGRADGYVRVVRGWSYLPVSNPTGATRYCRSANRSGHLPEDANRATGFRIVLGEMPSTTPLPPQPPPLNQKDVKQTPARLPPPGGKRERLDPQKPYFVSFEQEQRFPPVRADAWGPVFGAWNHFSAICVCPNGDVLACWYTTVQESGRECGQAASRLRAGTDKWEPASFFFGVPDVNTHAPVLLSDGKRLFHFFTQSLAGWDDAAECMRVSDDSGATWSRPRIILSREDPLRMSQPCTAFVAADGRLVLAVDGDFAHRDERIMTSTDGGQTWKVGKGDLRKAAGQYAIHPAVVERGDGAYLAFLRGPDPMPAFVSKDHGASWQRVASPFPGIKGGQKAVALKLASGSLLFASFDNNKKLVGGGTFVALSLDDGKTWPHIRKVEGPSGYLSLAQAPRGEIYLFGPRGSSLRCVEFNEAWVRSADPSKT
jgi:formylglycine-generating enzyme